ncbi:MAG: hypothetical protein DRP09_15870 [Candidatus Thorarchaeota archaeon]|nr:MAG: hypothetical protein DRP09_15870 [Candidatus Thorarchaeota archaeon]
MMMIRKEFEYKIKKLEDRIKELESLVGKMKSCANCRHVYEGYSFDNRCMMSPFSKESIKDTPCYNEGLKYWEIQR